MWDIIVAELPPPKPNWLPMIGLELSLILILLMFAPACWAGTSTLTELPTQPNNPTT